MFHLILLVQVLATWILDPASRCRFVLLQILCICNYFSLSAFNLFMWFVFHCDFAHQFTRFYTMCSCEVDEFDDVSRSGHSTLLFVLFAVPALPRTSPHFPALPRTVFPALPRTSPHFPALPRTSLDFFGLVGLGEIRMLFSFGFLWIP